MTEIPKDGKSYLAWHKIYGHVFICYVEGLDGYWKVNDLVRFFYNDLERWMDEKGQWHEIKNSCTPNICKRCRKEVIDSIDAQIKLLSKSGEG